MPELLDALKETVARLRRFTLPLGAEQLRTPAYPTEWTVADVLSHIGSGAVIMQARLDAALAGTELADDFAQPIWDAWNAKTPEAKAADALIVDGGYVERIESVSDEDRASVRIPLGPMEIDVETLVSFRLNEHVLHTWDIEVALDPSTTLPADAAGLVLEHVSMIIQYTGKPTGSEHDLHVRTTDPAGDFTLSLRADGVSLSPSDPVDDPDLELPTEAFVRLVYGRLDPDHTPPVRGPADLDELRPRVPRRLISEPRVSDSPTSVSAARPS